MKMCKTGILFVLSILLLNACTASISNIKIYSIVPGYKKPLRELTLIGVAGCRNSSIRIKTIDDKVISDNDYTAVALAPGEHNFTVDIDYEKLNNDKLTQRFSIEWKRVSRIINVQAGKFYLVCPVQKNNKEWVFWLEERNFEFNYYYKYRDDIEFI